jgi:hypothetical protein
MHPHVFTFHLGPACTCRLSEQFSEADADIAAIRGTRQLLESVAIFITGALSKTERAHERQRRAKIILEESGHPLVVIFCFDATLLFFSAS